MQVPGVGGFLRWRQGRRVLQAGMLVLAAVVIFDGLVGPQVSPMNLAGVAPWIHWRGLLILGLLVNRLLMLPALATQVIFQLKTRC